MSTKRPQGPNVKKLIIRRMSQLAVPIGGGFGDALEFLTDKHRIITVAREATAWAFEAIDAVKAAPDCPWTTDEEIAGEIVRRIEKR